MRKPAGSLGPPSSATLLSPHLLLYTATSDLSSAALTLRHHCRRRHRTPPTISRAHPLARRSIWRCRRRRRSRLSLCAAAVDLLLNGEGSFTPANLLSLLFEEIKAISSIPHKYVTKMRNCLVTFFCQISFWHRNLTKKKCVLFPRR